MSQINFKVVGEETFYDFKTNPKGDEMMLVHVQFDTGIIKTMSFPKADWIKKDKQLLVRDWLGLIGKR